MADHGLLAPGSSRADGATDDTALVAAMLRVEVAWLRALAATGAVDVDHAEALARVAADWDPDLTGLAAAGEAAGNPVVPLVAGLRERVRDAAGQQAATLVHRGLTSQDVLDTALVLLARDALTRVRSDLRATAQALGRLADTHRGTVMAGRTLTQHAVPVTFGLKAAQHLVAVLDAEAAVTSALAGLPVQCGGAAGTLALAGELAEDPVAVARATAAELGLRWPGLPWHTRRAPLTRVADALVETGDVLGALASDVVLLSRPEIGELREAPVAGRGGSSTMPHKQNPVLSVLVRSAGLQAPLLGAQVHQAAALAVDERPDGAWHAEWPALRRLLTLAVTAASQAAELAGGLQVDAAAMTARAGVAAADLLAERGPSDPAGDRTDDTDPASYLGAAGTFVDVALARLHEHEEDR